MLTEILENLHNYFDLRHYYGTYSISSGALTADFLLPGQYFRIVGSVLNDGVYQYPAVDLQDEKFTGEIWALAIPKSLIQLSVEIEAWVAEHPTTDVVSESFGGYSYTRASNRSGAAVTWENVFCSQLNRWRKL